ncbi:hypothetical protein BC827DRAFT_1169871 [Russula dissimulans]|nr:hypothetical protein BC827DRAFT_1169871 [Russula dissimulans]
MAGWGDGEMGGATEGVLVLLLDRIVCERHGERVYACVSMALGKKKLLLCKQRWAVHQTWVVVGAARSRGEGERGAIIICRRRHRRRRTNKKESTQKRTEQNRSAAEGRLGFLPRSPASSRGGVGSAKCRMCVDLLLPLLCLGGLVASGVDVDVDVCVDVSVYYYYKQTAIDSDRADRQASVIHPFARALFFEPVLIEGRGVGMAWHGTSIHARVSGTNNVLLRKRDPRVRVAPAPTRRGNPEHGVCGGLTIRPEQIGKPIHGEQEKQGQRFY